jgi:hypothetical protein
LKDEQIASGFNQREKSGMTRDNLKRSMAAALVAAGVLFATTPAQATIVDLIHGDSGSINGTLFDFTTSKADRHRRHPAVPTRPGRWG